METARQVFSRLTEGVVNFKADTNITPLKQAFHAGIASQFSVKYDELFEMNNDFLPEQSLDYFGIGFEEEVPKNQDPSEEDEEMKDRTNGSSDEEEENEEEAKKEEEAKQQKNKKKGKKAKKEKPEHENDEELEPIRQDFIFIGDAKKSDTVTKQEIDKLLTKSKHVALHKIFRGGILPPVLIFVNSNHLAKRLHKELSESQSLGSTSSTSSFSNENSLKKDTRSLTTIFDPNQKNLNGKEISMDELSNRIDHIDNQTPETQIEEIVSRIKLGELWVLVCVDKVIEKLKKITYVPCVIHYDFPSNTDAYIKRTKFAAKTKNSKSFGFWSTHDIESLKAFAYFFLFFYNFLKKFDKNFCFKSVMQVVKKSEISTKALESDERTKFLLSM